MVSSMLSFWTNTQHINPAHQMVAATVVAYMRIPLYNLVEAASIYTPLSLAPWK
jgi:hypothetical protein